MIMHVRTPADPSSPYVHFREPGLKQLAKLARDEIRVNVCINAFTLALAEAR